MFVRSLALTLAAASLLVVPVSVTPASAAPDNFTPRPGPTFNNPVGSAKSKRAIYRRIIRSIDSTRRGSDINIFSWNFLTQEGKTKLLRAQRRGVRVRLVMDDRNLTQIDNPSFRQLRRELRQYNNRKNLRKARRSWARVCRGTCRSTKGSAHSKFFLFSRVGKARRVVMQGSANFTVASTTNQWNDVYTHTRDRRVWRFYNRIFRQAAKDRRVRSPYAELRTKNFSLIHFPIRGRDVRDPVMRMLNRVKCTGATNTPHHKTRVQIAPDVIRHDRGMRLALKLRQLHNRGCKVRVGYTVIGVRHGRMLRDAGVPLKHLVQDFDGDGEFDNYFHMKSMVIRGHYGRDRSGYAMLNGSANWSGLGGRSDENVGIYRNRGRVLRYLEHLDYWYDNFPSDGFGAASARRSLQDDRLIFGVGKNAVYENGESVTGGAYNPFAQIQMD